MMVQNQSGNHPLRWDKRGTVMKCEGFDKYQAMIDGSRKLAEQKEQKEQKVLLFTLTYL